MRLIDLDQTVFVPIVDESKGGVSYEMQMTLAEFFDKFLDGFKPEVVDAIPVEWLKAHRTEYFEDWGDEPVTIEQALIMWQKEQDAKLAEIKKSKED